MKKVLGRKHIDSKESFVVLQIVVLIACIIFGIVVGYLFSIFERNLHYYWVLIIGLLFTCLGVFFLFLIARSYKRQSEGPIDTIIYDTKEKTFDIAVGGSYTSMNIDSIEDIKYHNNGIVYTPNASVVTSHNYGEIIVIYRSNNKKRKIKSNSVNDVLDVYVKMFNIIYK